MKIIKQYIVPLVFIFLAPVFLHAQSGEIFTLTDEALKGDFAVQISKLQWKYRAGDDAAWAARDFDDAGWETIEGTTITPEMLARPDWNGRAWFRLRFKIEEKLVGQNIVLAGTQRGATEVFLDGEPLAKFGEISETNVVEYNPNHLPMPFRLDGGAEHSLAVRFASSTFREASGTRAWWLANGGVYPGISPTFLDGSDLTVSIGGYADYASMRGSFLFVGILLALALLHFLLFVFYPVERANLFTVSTSALSPFNFSSNFRSYGHLGVLPSIVFSFTSILMLAATFTGLLAFIRLVFGRPLGIVFWAMTALWTASVLLNLWFLNKAGYFQALPNILIGLSFTFIIFEVIAAAIAKRAGAWILLGGVQVYAIAMMITLLTQLRIVSPSQDVIFVVQLATLLAVPIAVSIFLARKFARTSRDLKAQLEQVEQLSLEKIEQERHSSELRAENERRAKELEEARQLQLSMLPKKLPQIPNLEIAAFMKPASEVGGDYYDFHVGADSTLTVAVGDATGHGLKAGSVVTATKSLFNAFADDENIPQIFSQTSRALKKMNLRGLFMAMAMVKIKNGNLTICAAGMPSALIYRAATRQVQEIVIRAMPLGSVSNFAYEQQRLNLSAGDCVVLMSDGFPEMFNAANEMIGFEKAAEILPEIAHESPQEIINKLVKVGEQWAGTRPPDDDVTFVVLKVGDGNLN